jgi:hypothetical protein
MTELELRERVVAQALEWLGYNETNRWFEIIIDVYNNCSPLPRGYRMTYNDPWCATFLSAVAILCGVNDIMPCECSCDVMISLYKAMGRWCEDDGYIPQPGDPVFYDWQDDGAGDCTGGSDHVGLVENCDGKTITVIEGNAGDAVARRTLAVNGRYIRGYGLPDYASIAPYADAWMTDNTPTPAVPTAPANTENDTAAPEVADAAPIEAQDDTGLVVRYGAKSDAVAAMQHLILYRGGNLPRYGADGEFGDETAGALRDYQMDHGLGLTGVCDAATWAALVE